MGHEVSGVVAALGEGVDPAWLGARVVCETYFSTCGVCEWCRDGRPICAPSDAPSARSPTAASPSRWSCRRTVVHRIPDWLDERGGACRAARVRLPLPARPAEGVDRRPGARDRAGADRPARGAGGAGAGRRRARRWPAGRRARGWAGAERLGFATDSGGTRRPASTWSSSARAAPGAPRRAWRPPAAAGTLRADRRVREAGDRAARPRLPEGARPDLGVRLDAAVLAAGAPADRRAAVELEPLVSEVVPLERVGAGLRGPAGGAGDQGRVRSARHATGRRPSP